MHNNRPTPHGKRVPVRCIFGVICYAYECNIVQGSHGCLFLYLARGELLGSWERNSLAEVRSLDGGEKGYLAKK